MLVGTDVCVRMVYVWEETGVPVWLGEQMTILHADARYRIYVAAVRGECVNWWYMTLWMIFILVFGFIILYLFLYIGWF